MRTLSIDYGTRRVGLAMSDEGARFATPVEVLQVTNPAQAVAPILALIKKEGVQRLLIGLPINMDDTLGPIARAVVTFAKDLQSQTRLPLIFVDERLSSFDAEQQLGARRRAGEKLTHKRKKEQLDAIAAANLLQQFLDGKLPAIDI